MKYIFTLLVLVVSLFNGYSQSIERSVIGSAGTEQKQSTIVLSSTVGESAVMSLEKSTLIITQGFQQSYAVIEDTSGNGNGGDTTFVMDNEFAEFSLYPNPSNSYVIFTSNFNSEFTLEVFDVLGKVIYTTNYNDVLDKEHYINVQDWENGVYHFRFVNNNKHATSYKVVKQ